MLSHGEEPLFKLLDALVGKRDESCARIASMWSQQWLCFFASVHANMEDNPPHVFIPKDMLQPVEKVVYRDARHTDVRLLPPENTTESPIRTLEMPGPTLHSAHC